MRPLKVGLYLPIREARASGHHADVTRGWRALAAMVQLAEEIGFDSAWVPDHLLFRWPGQESESQGTWEGWSVVAALAATTARMELGTLVSCTAFRNPGLIAKMALTVDEICGGRFILGLGAGYHEPEFRAFGFSYADRASQFEEALITATSLLRTGTCTFCGRHLQMQGCELRPRGSRNAGPPIMIATSNPSGMAKPRMHRLLVEHADLWNGWLAFWRSWPDAVPPLREVIDRECVIRGRDPSTLRRTVTILAAFPDLDPVPMRSGEEPLIGSPAVMAEALTGFAREGIEHVQIQINPGTLAGLRAMAPVLELLDR